MNRLPGYSDAVWNLFQSTPRAGTFSPGTPGVSSAEARSPAARTVLQLQLRIEDGVVADARFRAYGCPTTIAVGAWLAGWCVGRRPAELQRLQAGEIRAALEIPEQRAHCALLGEDVLRATLRLDGDTRS